jgi:hypothetical protein
MSEFNLSKFIEDDDDVVDGKISPKYVKEFIRLLKEISFNDYGFSYGSMCVLIDKLAGEKLI